MSVVGGRSIVAAGFLLAATMARSQQAPSVSGTVIDPSKNPLPATQVSVRGTRLGAATDEAGRFRIVLTGVSDSAVTLDVRRIGRVSTSRTVRSGEQGIVITLEESAATLDQVVVTGQPGATQKRALPTSLSTVDVHQALESSAPPDFQTLINGRVPNAVILNNSGMIGSGATVNIRGYATFSLSNQPLIYVDGVRVDNDQGTGPTNQAFGASTTTRWNDIDPDDIDHVEVIKGPAATTIYGTEASHGVIQIFTRAGTVGRSTWQFTTRQGFNQFANPSGRLFTNYDVNASGDTVGVNQYDFYTGQGHSLFQEGWNQSYNLSVGGGTPNVRYYVSGNFKKDDGVTKPNNQYTATPRAQVTYMPSDKLSVATNLGYVTGRTNLEYEAGGGGTTWTTFYADPANMGTPRDGFYTAPPQAYYDQYTIYQTFSRVTGGVDITHRPTDWFSHHLTFGVDQAYENGVELSPRNADPDHSFFFGTDADSGFVNLTNQKTTLNTFTYNATGRFKLPANITAATTVGADAYLRQTEVTRQSRSDFAFPGLKSISSATSGSVTQTDSTAPDNTVGVFAQEELSWNNRLFLTGGFRVDDNSAFGSKFNRVYYPKVGASWVVSEEPFFPKTPVVSSIRLRGAYGESGQAPVPFSSVASYQSTTGPGGVPSVTTLSVGNANLGPEKSYETELGFDASFFHDRAGIEYTYYMGGTRDAILELPAAPSSGYPGDRFVNAGSLWKNGYELTLRGSPIQRDRLGLDLAFTLSHNDAVVRNIGPDPELNPSQYIYDIVGYPVNSWFGQKIVSAKLDATGNPIDVMCDGGPPHHTPVPCADAPNVLLGRTSPNLEGSFSPTLRVAPGFTFNALFDFKRGYFKLNGNQRVRCHLFDLCRENWYPSQYPATVIAADDMGSSYYGDLVQNASFTKLRVLSVSYAVPSRFASRIGANNMSLTFAAQNVFTWTNYPGLDPEGSFQSGSRGLGQWEQAILPQLRQFMWVVNLTY